MKYIKKKLVLANVQAMCVDKEDEQVCYRSYLMMARKKGDYLEALREITKGTCIEPVSVQGVMIKECICRVPVESFIQICEKIPVIEATNI